MARRSSILTTRVTFDFFSSQKKIFTVDYSVNHQNDRWICRDPINVPAVFQSKKTASVTVLDVTSGNDDVMSPHFYKKGETVHKDVYLRALQSAVIPWMDRVTYGYSYTVHMDGSQSEDDPQLAGGEHLTFVLRIANLPPPFILS